MTDKEPMKTGDAPALLRTHLDIVRTVLANERTVLAYIRTALSFLAAGALLIKFTDSQALVLTGWLLLPIGVAVLLLGGRRYWTTRRNLGGYYENPPKDLPQ